MSEGILGGSSFAQRALPCFPGYAMGGIIRTGELELPYLERQVFDIENEIVAIQKRIEQLRQPKKEQLAQPSQEEIQRQGLTYSSQIRQLKSTKEKVDKKMKAFLQEKEESSFSEIMLPIDYSRSSLDYRHRSDESENMHFIILNKLSKKREIEQFTEHLTKMHYLPTVVELMNQISQSILNQTNQENQEVCLLGSFVTLSHVRVIDPIVIREDATLGELKNEKTASKYSVICESVLGGVFIGFGVQISKHQSQEQESKDVKSITSTLKTFSYVSQGAIPRTDNFSLWDTYNSWKDKLTTNEHCGFPIAFKVRELTDILKENNII